MMLYGCDGDAPTCANCGDTVSVRPDLDWYQDEDVCNTCAQDLLDEAVAENLNLREELMTLRDDIIKNAEDTVWVGPCETACERITTILGDDWGKDGSCAPRAKD